MKGIYVHTWTPGLEYNKNHAIIMEAKRHGFDYCQDEPGIDYTGYDVCVVLGCAGPCAEFCRANKIPVFLMTDGAFMCDQKYIPEYPYLVGLNWPGAMSDDYWSGIDEDRKHVLSYKLQPHNPQNDGYILFAHQNMPDLYGESRVPVMQELMDRVMEAKPADRKIVLRTHPQFGRGGFQCTLPEGDYEVSERPLADDLAGAYCLVTHQSKAAVQAVFAGIAVYLSDNGLANGVSEKSLVHAVNPDAGKLFHSQIRSAWQDGWIYNWVRELTFRHWRLDEIFPMVTRWYENGQV